MKLFLKISNLCNHNTSTLRTDWQTDGQTDGQTTCHSNTALCVASRGKNLVDIFYHITQLAAHVAKLVLGCILDPRPFLGRGGRVSDGTIWKSEGGLIYALHCYHCAISNHSSQFAIECLRRSINSTIGVGWVTFGSKFQGVPCRVAQIRDDVVCREQAPSLINREIIFEHFEMWSRVIPQRHGHTTCSCRSNTALCVASHGNTRKPSCRWQNPCDAKACQNCSNSTCLSPTTLVYLHSFSCCCVRQLGFL